MWAEVPEPVLKGWIDKDPAFAAALHAAGALAAAHGVRQDERPTSAMLRVLLVAMGNGATKRDAIGLAGFRDSRLRALLRTSSAFKALLDTARRARPLPARSSGVRGPACPAAPDASSRNPGASGSSSAPPRTTRPTSATGTPAPRTRFGQGAGSAGRHGISAAQVPGGTFLMAMLGLIAYLAATRDVTDPERDGRHLA